MLRTRVMAGRVAGVVLAVVLATIFAAVHSAELLVPGWRVRVGAPAPVTLRLPGGMRVEQIAGRPGIELQWRTHSVSVPRGSVPTGEVGALAEALTRSGLLFSFDIIA